MGMILIDDDDDDDIDNDDENDCNEHGCIAHPLHLVDGEGALGRLLLVPSAPIDLVIITVLVIIFGHRHHDHCLWSSSQSCCSLPRLRLIFDRCRLSL